MIRQGASVHCAQTKALPIPRRFGDLAVRLSVVKPGRKLHLDSPWLPLHPSKAFQVGRGRRQGIGRVVRPDIALAISGEINSVFQIGCRHELRVTHRTRPTASHGACTDITGLQDSQRCNQLTFKKRSAAPVKGQRGERADNIPAATEIPIVAFHAPNGGDNLLVDTICGLNPCQRVSMIAQRGASVFNAAV